MSPPLPITRVIFAGGRSNKIGTHQIGIGEKPGVNFTAAPNIQDPLKSMGRMYEMRHNCTMASVFWGLCLVVFYTFYTPLVHTELNSSPPRFHAANLAMSSHCIASEDHLNTWLV